MSRWLVLVAKLPAQPSRHRVGVWRELRRIGVLSLGQGIWAVPDVPVFADGIARAVALTEQADGQVVTLTASGRGPQDADRLREMFGAARSADWAEFLADCDTFEAESPRRSASPSSPWPSWRKRNSRWSGCGVGTGT
nr:Chromate resistance protein ChrB [Streptomyces sp. MUSC 14]